MANVQKKSVVGFTPYWTDELFICELSDGTQSRITQKEVIDKVVDETGMVDVSIGEPKTNYITFQEYLDTEFLTEANEVLGSIINDREHG